MESPQETRKATPSRRRRKARSPHRRSIRVLRRCLLATGIIIVSGACVIAGFNGLKAQAFSACENLRQALRKGHWPAVNQAHMAADTFINRAFCQETSTVLAKSTEWIQGQLRAKEKLQTRIEAIQTQQRSIADMPLQERADIENDLRNLPDHIDNLSPIWESLCLKEEAQLRKQKEDIIVRLQAPLPPPVELTGDVSKDLEAVQSLLTELRPRQKLHKQAQAIYGIKDEQGILLEEFAEQHRQLEADILLLKKTNQALVNVRSYKQYLDELKTFSPAHYSPAIALKKYADTLPSEEELGRRLMSTLTPVPSEKLPLAQKIFLKRAASFGKQMPASRHQLHLMEDIFTADVLRVEFIRLRLPSGEFVFTENQPKLDLNKCLRVERSVLDPHYEPMGNNILTLENPQFIQQRTVNCAPLLRQLNITRANFFPDKNLPALLTEVIRADATESSPLAKAYIFYTLLRVLQAHEQPALSGLEYCPELQADINSFRKLMRRCGVRLELGCWMHPGRDDAESAYEQWFRERQDRDYASVIARNFKEKVMRRPVYAGYTDEHGTICIVTPLPINADRWYILNGQPVRCTGEKELPPFAPIFTTKIIP